MYSLLDALGGDLNRDTSADHMAIEFVAPEPRPLEELTETLKELGVVVDRDGDTTHVEDVFRCRRNLLNFFNFLTCP